MNIKDMPISKVEWIDVDLLKANDYNPNVVLSKEMQLLRLSILKQGWIQPILTTKDFTIIDGFHRSTLAKVHEDVRNMTDGKVPVVVLDLSEAQRKLLTIRINRAKGTHVALKMSDIIKDLVHNHDMPVPTICKEIGATKDEIELLLLDNVFKMKKIDENTKYSKAWIPK